MKSLLLGDNGFIGVSHLSQARARETIERLNLDRIIQVIDESIACGATGYTFTAHPTNSQILKMLNDTGTISGKFELYPLLPNAQGSARIANEKGTPGLAKEVLSRLLVRGKRKALIKTGVSVMRMDPSRMLCAYVDMELGDYLSVKPENAVLRAVLLHEAVADLGISFRARDLFEGFIEHIRDSGEHASPGFVTRNFARFVKFFREEALPLRDVVIMTPFNSIGFQMNPSREACETSLRNLGTEAEVIAMSILAAGYIQVDQAVEYFKTLKNLSGAAVGVSSKQHAKETFSKLRTLLET